MPTSKVYPKRVLRLCGRRCELRRDDGRESEVAAVGFGNARPIASNATAAGREQNRRVEVVIAGPSIGDKALWDRPYSLRSQR